MKTTKEKLQELADEWYRTGISTGRMNFYKVGQYAATELEEIIAEIPEPKYTVGDVVKYKAPYGEAIGEIFEIQITTEGRNYEMHGEPYKIKESDIIGKEAKNA